MCRRLREISSRLTPTGAELIAPNVAGFRVVEGVFHFLGKTRAPPRRYNFLYAIPSSYLSQAPDMVPATRLLADSETVSDPTSVRKLLLKNHLFPGCKLPYTISFILQLLLHHGDFFADELASW